MADHNHHEPLKMALADHLAQAHRYPQDVVNAHGIVTLQRAHEMHHTPEEMHPPVPDPIEPEVTLEIDFESRESAREFARHIDFLKETYEFAGGITGVRGGEFDRDVLDDLDGDDD